MAVVDLLMLSRAGEVAPCNSDAFRVSETDSQQIEKAPPFYPRSAKRDLLEHPAAGMSRI